MDQPLFHSEIVRKPSRRMSLVDIAYESILEAIVDQKLIPGLRVNVDSIAAGLEMSNTPIREALARLVSSGLVQQISNRGFIVTPILSEVEYHHLFDVRCLLEIESLRHAEFTPEILAKLKDIAQMQLDMDYGMTYRGFIHNLQADESFHVTLLQASNNRFFCDAWKSLNFYPHVSRLHTQHEAFEQNQHKTSLREHVQITELLAEARRDDAVELLRLHIREVEQRLLQPTINLVHYSSESETI